MVSLNGFCSLLTFRTPICWQNVSKCHKANAWLFVEKLQKTRRWFFVFQHVQIGIIIKSNCYSQNTQLTRDHNWYNTGCWYTSNVEIGPKRLKTALSFDQEHFLIFASYFFSIHTHTTSTTIRTHSRMITLFFLINIMFFPITYVVRVMLAFIQREKIHVVCTVAEHIRPFIDSHTRISFAWLNAQPSKYKNAKIRHQVNFDSIFFLKAWSSHHIAHIFRASMPISL